MTIEALRQSLPQFAKDIKLNLSSVMSVEGAPGLSSEQIDMIALASAYSTHSIELVSAIHADVISRLTKEAIEAAKTATSLMAMNNIYYRFLHLVSDKSYINMPANLRMNSMRNPGVEMVDFEMMSLAISAINGCGMCIDAHVKQLHQASVSQQGIQSIVRIAATVNATAQALAISEIDISN